MALNRRTSGLPLICLVCGDTARGINFDLMSCMSCKAFFRRHTTKRPVKSAAFDFDFDVDFGLGSGSALSAGRELSDHRENARRVCGLSIEEVSRSRNESSTDSLFLAEASEEETGGIAASILRFSSKIA